MSVTIIVQGLSHSEISRYSDDPEGTLLEMCGKAAEGSMLGGIIPHGDTMFNSYQLRFLVDEIDAMPARNDAEKEMWGRLRDAAQTAIRRSGYLWFNGD
ncbi:hypothetical protein [Nocardia sp. R7R-8]|uniref:hypothetical protein n=1 Tax=Nocardia sp. R7R-8 TaxID=3459304 RepID=UPI00403D60C0